MRTLLLALGALAACTLGCATAPERELPRDALALRARTGSEPPAGPRGAAVVAAAAAQIGRPYCWGGVGPRCFDCSGLVQTAWRTTGARLPRTSTEMAAHLAEVPLAGVRAGDILWWPGHVAIYAGDGWEIEALDSRHGVVRRRVSNPWRALRPSLPAG